jgi:hypothetical protein
LQHDAVVLKAGLRARPVGGCAKRDQQDKPKYPSSFEHHTLPDSPREAHKSDARRFRAPAKDQERADLKCNLKFARFKSWRHRTAEAARAWARLLRAQGFAFLLPDRHLC